MAVGCPEAARQRGALTVATLQVTRSVVVRLPPSEAFAAFTRDIDRWYVRGPYSWANPARAVGIRFEGGLGGRLFEVWNEATGEGFERGRITAWEPGALLGLRYHFAGLAGPESNLTVRFEPVDGGTNVTLTHTSEGMPPEQARVTGGRAWRALMAAFEAYARAL